jgi:hypothetical protein
VLRTVHVQGWPELCMYVPYKTICVDISLLKLPYIHRVYSVVLALRPLVSWSWAKNCTCLPAPLSSYYTVLSQATTQSFHRQSTPKSRELLNSPFRGKSHPKVSPLPYLWVDYRTLALGHAKVDSPTTPLG